MKKCNFGKIRLKRCFNIFEPRIYRILLFSAVCLILFVVKTSIDKGALDLSNLVAAIIGLLIISALFICRCPKYISADNGCISFSGYICLTPRNFKPKISISYRKGLRFLKVNYYVSGIEEVKFSQNSTEKRFDVGRISFSGKVVLEAKRDADSIIPPEVFTIYGIPDFSEFKKHFENQI